MNRSTNTYVAVVDDDESLCRSLGRLLRGSGIQPVTYSSAEAFLADTQHPQFHCLVLDIQLGGMSGIELQRHLTASGSQTPVIFITAHNEDSFREEALSGGCAAFFHKSEPGANVVQAIRLAASPVQQTR